MFIPFRPKRTKKKSNSDDFAINEIDRKEDTRKEAGDIVGSGGNCRTRECQSTGNAIEEIEPEQLRLVPYFPFWKLALQAGLNLLILDQLSVLFLVLISRVRSSLAHKHTQFSSYLYLAICNRE